MAADKAVLEFARLLRADVIDRSHHSDDEEGAGEFKENTFTERVISDLVDAGVIEDAEVCYFEERGIKVNGYGVNDDGDRLDLITTIYQHGAEPESVTGTDIKAAVQRVRRFFQFCLEGKGKDIDRASPAYEMAHQIRAVSEDLSRLRILVFTDGIAGVRKLDDAEVDGTWITHDIWDIERLHRLDSSGRPHESVELDIKGRYGSALPCLDGGGEQAGYHCYLAIVPGQMLHDLYDEYRGQLLELNVRSFLQAKRKVNKGIQETLRTEPGRFLAYNNGITVTAEQVKTEKLPNGSLGISFIRGLQIVNGGQTTASIHLARRKGRIPIDNVSVQMKLNVVGPQLLEELVPKISRFANSQNTVNDADFSANDPFHRRVEELSRTIWAPGEESQWFYERARGQYQVEKALAAARKSSKKAFDTQYPSSQVFNKTDLAKYANSWDMRPFAVCKGNQKNFGDFTLALQAKGQSALPDEQYFKRLVAKTILFREIEKIVRKEGYEAYRANIVAYTVAYLAFKTVGRIDLDKIWSEQDISPALREYASAVASKVHSVIKKTSGNIGEWTKKTECWDQVRALDVKVPRAIAKELASDGHDGVDGERRIEATDSASPEQLEQMSACMQLTADDWLKIHKWGVATGALAKWQAGIAMTLCQYAASGWQKKPSVKQAKHGAVMIHLARDAEILAA